MTLFFNPVLQKEEHQRILSGYVGDIRITQGFVLVGAILMETAIVMVLLSRVLPYGANRWANIFVGLLHTASVIWSMTGGPVNVFYVFSPPSRLPAPCSLSGTRGPGGSQRCRQHRQPSCGQPHRPAHDSPTRPARAANAGVFGVRPSLCDDLVMDPLVAKLQGGGRRSIGVVGDVPADPDQFRLLVDAMLVPDAVVRMRAADAVEKITRRRADLLRAGGPGAHRGGSDRPAGGPLACRAAAAAACPHPQQRTQAVSILGGFLGNESRIVRTFAMPALADLTEGDEQLRRRVLPLLAELTCTGTPPRPGLSKRAEQAIDGRWRTVWSELAPGPAARGNQPRRRRSMRSSSDWSEMPGGVLVVVGSSGQMSRFLTMRGDSNSICLPPIDRRAAPPARTLLSQSVRGPYIGMNR